MKICLSSDLGLGSWTSSTFIPRIREHFG